MRTMNLKGHLLVTALLSCLMFLVGTSGVFAHPPVTLYNAAGSAITQTAGPDDLTAAYSAKKSCGTCHDYDSIEQHSYHAQIGANQFVGWAPWNPNSSNPFKKGVAAKGKNWVQSPGHLGKW